MSLKKIAELRRNLCQPRYQLPLPPTPRPFFDASHVVIASGAVCRVIGILRTTVCVEFINGTQSLLAQSEIGRINVAVKR